MKKKIFFLIGCIFSGYYAFCQDSLPKTLSLQDCISLAIKNNRQVKEAQYQADYAKTSWGQAKGNRLPFINFQMNQGISDGRSIDPFSNGYVDQNVGYANYGLNANLLLWNGNSARNSAKQFELSYEASKMDLKQEQDNTTIAVILAYLQEQSMEEQWAAAQEQTTVSKKQEDRLKILNDQGAIAPADYFNLKGQRASDELNVVNIENNLANAKLALMQLLNMSYSPDIQFQKITTSNLPQQYGTTVDIVFQQALQQLAVIKSASLKKSAADLQIKAAKGAMLPSLFLDGGVGTNYSSIASRSIFSGTTDVVTDQYVLIDNAKVYVVAPQNNYSNQKISYGSQWKNNLNSSISIGLRIPILNGLQSKTRLQQAKIELDKTSFEEKSIQEQLHRDIEQAYVNMESAYKKLLKLNEQEMDYAESFRIAEARFNEGVITSVDYLIAKNNLYQSRQNGISAKYEYELRIKILDFYQGSLSF
ncbi:MAG: TolC family protein [Bacteroidetes bacterium]|nr:TolC family protein [Bacteroidota bacterium]